jgi:tRNA(fMet)-specific endonuclease VapC
VKALLDTNAFTALWGGDERVLEALAQADHVLVSPIVVGELHFGFRGGTRISQNRARLAEFLNKPTVHILSISIETAEVYGQIKDGLRRAGTPIPINDVWISAQAIETGAVLVTLDSHFHSVPGVRQWEF